MPRRLYYWQNTPVGKCHIKMRREMLMPKGFVHYPSESRNRKQMDLGFAIVYDDKYVYHCIAKNVIRNLGITSEKELLRVVTKAWNYYQEQLNNKEDESN